MRWATRLWACGVANVRLSHIQKCVKIFHIKHFNWNDKMSSSRSEANLRRGNESICIAMAHELFIPNVSFELPTHTAAEVTVKWEVEIVWRKKFLSRISFLSLIHSKYLEHNDKELCSALRRVRRISSFSSRPDQYVNKNIFRLLCFYFVLVLVVCVVCCFLFCKGSQPSTLLLLAVVYAKRRWNQNFLPSPFLPLSVSFPPWVTNASHSVNSPRKTWSE